MILDFQSSQASRTRADTLGELSVPRNDEEKVKGDVGVVCGARKPPWPRRLGHAQSTRRRARRPAGSAAAIGDWRDMLPGDQGDRGDCGSERSSRSMVRTQRPSLTAAQRERALRRRGAVPLVDARHAVAHGPHRCLIKSAATAVTVPRSSTVMRPGRRGACVERGRSREPPGSASSGERASSGVGWRSSDGRARHGSTRSGWNAAFSRPRLVLPRFRAWRRKAAEIGLLVASVNLTEL